MPNPKCLGLIPARSGSKRIPNKNIKILNGHPLLKYTIWAALRSGVFSRVIVSTDSEEIAKIALECGAEVPFLRPAEFAGDSSPDIEWTKDLLTRLRKEGDLSECFAILRPTSPFRRSQTIQRAWKLFLEDSKADSLRAVEKCSQHPAKMWKVDGSRMKPIMANPDAGGLPWHSMPYQQLQEICVQNASLEIAWCDTVLVKGSIAGEQIIPFLTEGYEGFDINKSHDWLVAEHLINNNMVQLEDPFDK